MNKKPSHNNIWQRWTPEQRELFTALFPLTPNNNLALRFGISERTCVNFGKRLQLSKRTLTRHWYDTLTPEQLDHFRAHYPTTPSHILARHYGVHTDSIRRLASHLSLQKDPDYLLAVRRASVKLATAATPIFSYTTEQRRAIAERTSNITIRRDKIRYFNGLPQLTRRKFGQNLQRKSLLQYLRRRGYIIPHHTLECYILHGHTRRATPEKELYYTTRFGLTFDTIIV